MFSHFFKCLTTQEETQLMLSGIHAKNRHDEAKYLAEIKMNVNMKWESTLAFIDEQIAARSRKAA